MSAPQMHEPENKNKGQGFWQDPRVRGFLRRNKYACYGVLIAIILAILVMSIGLGYTLMMALFVAIGWGIGAWRDRNPVLLRFLNRFF